MTCRILFATLLVCLIGAGTVASAQWTQKSSNTSQDLTAVTFIDSNTGFVCGAYNTLLKTTDGGNSWQSISNSTVPVASYVSIDALDANRLFVARNGLYASGNGGNSFSQWGSWNSSAYAIQNIKAINDSTVFITKGGYILKSTNRGTSWTSLYHNDHLAGELIFTGSDTAYAASGISYDSISFGSIHKSTDGGTTWQDLILSSPEVIAMYFRTGTVGYYAAFGNTLYKTNNGGVSWTSIGTPVNSKDDYITSILFSNDTLGYAATVNGFIYKTKNGGNTWAVDYQGHQSNGVYDVPLVALKELANHKIIAIGNSGTILKWNGPLSTPDVKLHKISVYPNPASQYLTVSISDADQYRCISLYSVTGALVSRQDVHPGQHQYRVDVSQISRGMYTLRLTGLSGDYQERIIVQ